MRLKSIFWLFNIISAFSFLGSWYYWEVHGVEKLRVYIEKKAGPLIQGQLKIKTLSAPLGWPLEIQLATVQFESKKFAVEGQIDRISLKVSLKSFTLKDKKFHPEIVLKIRKPQIRLSMNNSAPEAAANSQPSQNNLIIPLQNLSDLTRIMPNLKDLNFSFQMNDGQIELNKNSPESFLLNNWNVKIDIDKLTNPIRFNQDFNTTMHFGNVGISLPVHVEGQTELKNGKIDLLGFRTKFLNIESFISGNLNLNQQSYHVLVRTFAPDLSKIPLNIPEFPIRSWKGSLKSDLEFRHDHANAPTYVLGSYQLKNFQAQLKYSNNLAENELITVDGETTINAIGQFQFIKQQTTALYFPILNWDINLTKSKIRYKNLFFKHPDVELASDGEIIVGQKFQIKKSRLKFYSLIVNSSGIIDFVQNSNFMLNFSTPSLKGFEAFFPSLSSSPLAGSLQGELEINGPLNDYKKLKIDVKKIELAQGAGEFTFKNEHQEYSGPFKIDIRGNGLIDKMKLERGQVVVNAKLNDMFLKFKDLFQKPKGEILSVDLVAQKNNTQFDIKQGTFNIGAGKIQLTGQPPLGPEDSFNLYLNISSLNIKKLSENVPLIKPYLNDGVYQTNLNFKGRLNSADFFQSPLTISGSQTLNLASFTYASNAKSKDPTPPEVREATVPKAFLKDTPLIRGINLSTQLNINEFNYDKLKILGIKLATTVQNKSMSATGQIQNAFGGDIKLNKIQLPLTVDNPQIDYNVVIKNMQVQPALAWVSEKNKDLVSGALAADMQGKSFLPTSPDFLPKFISHGKFNIKDGVLNTLPFEKMAKDALAKIPSVGQIKNSAGPLRTNISAAFVLDKSALHLKDFIAKTPRNEEMQLNGLVSLNLDANLAGNIALVDAPVSGSFFEANSDSHKRLIIPVRISGNLMKPEFSFADETIKQMTQKMIDYEKNKLVKSAQVELEKAKKQAESQLKQEAEKKKDEIKNQLGNELEKGLQDLLKK